MTVYVMVVVVFLAGGMKLSVASLFQSADECTAQQLAAPATLIGKSIKDSEGADHLILDAQTLPCTAITQQTHV